MIETDSSVEIEKKIVQQKKPAVIYTDGACRGNPGPGGWGVYIEKDKEITELCGGELNTTNNRMELSAAIKALEFLVENESAIIYTDSEYVRKGITEWMQNWKKNGWRTAAKKPVKNADLWQILDNEAAKYDIEWRWVKGHSGNFGNEKADQLANAGIDKLV